VEAAPQAGVSQASRTHRVRVTAAALKVERFGVTVMEPPVSSLSKCRSFRDKTITTRRA
jgi:hypothetical protein